jgi:hypothetical protein
LISIESMIVNLYASRDTIARRVSELVADLDAQA